mmetsp:Transcript_13506/g.42176  ORF Transcript_13506/g.42176 Transcript_13506/m.42176 type:complete len:250 (-) Transcript_13506:200-949(-)
MFTVVMPMKIRKGATLTTSRPSSGAPAARDAWTTSETYFTATPRLAASMPKSPASKTPWTPSEEMAQTRPIFSSTVPGSSRALKTEPTVWERRSQPVLSFKTSMVDLDTASIRSSQVGSLERLLCAIASSPKSSGVKKRKRSSMSSWPALTPMPTMAALNSSLLMVPLLSKSNRSKAVANTTFTCAKVMYRRMRCKTPAILAVPSTNCWRDTSGRAPRLAASESSWDSPRSSSRNAWSLSASSCWKPRA